MDNKKNWKAPEIETTEFSETANNPYEDKHPDGEIYEDLCGDKFPGYSPS